MGTSIRPEVTKKNRYWIDKHRYYELKHFCLQYPLWKKTYAGLEAFLTSQTGQPTFKDYGYGNPTEKCAMRKAYYSERMDMVEQAAREADETLAGYILKAVTEDLSYNGLRMLHNIPCGKDMYYEVYRKFFWILSNKRN